jgi:hypothetical protein
MTTVTVGHMLDRASDFEERMECFYADLRDRATKSGPRLLVYYLVRRRHHLPEALKSFAPEEITHIRSVQLRYDDTDFDPARLFAGRMLPSDVTGRELLSYAIFMVEQLIGFYRWLGQRPIGPEAERLLGALLRIEERHIIELKKMQAMDYF